MKYHFIGIKGRGMSALAQIMSDLGNEVQGSDKNLNYSFTEEGLKQRGILVLDHSEDNITNDMVLVKTIAAKDDNVELKKARELNIKVYNYFDLLKELISKHKTIAVSGCHGKTTTTSLISHVFNNIVGCNYLIGDGTGFAKEGNDYLMIEACEYRGTFLNYYPDIAIITNIDHDHVDYYETEADVVNAFQKFINQVKDIVFACGDNLNVRKLSYRKARFYGFNDNNDIVAKNILLTPSGSSFDVYIDNKFYHRVNLKLYGEHMILNALAVIGICHYVGFNKEQVVSTIESFYGAKRRFKEEVVGDIITVDDIAAHPVEVEAVIKSIRQKYPDREIVTIMRFTSYSLLKGLLDDWCNSLKLSDKVYITNIVSGREKQEDYPDVTPNIAINKIDSSEYIDNESIAKLLEYNNKILLFIGCDDLIKEYISKANMVKI